MSGAMISSGRQMSAGRILLFPNAAAVANAVNMHRRAGRD